MLPDASSFRIGGSAFLGMHDSSHTSDLGLVCAPRPRPRRQLIDWMTRTPGRRGHQRVRVAHPRMDLHESSSIDPRIPTVIARPPNRPKLAATFPRSFRLARALTESDNATSTSGPPSSRPSGASTSYGAVRSTSIMDYPRTLNLPPCVRLTRTSISEYDPADLVHPPRRQFPL
ncbi:hypothetical protein DFH07DRAFT_852784 [Mycena maculata]|uniref:Uncharacterized protein n=1 Tax=Mycena maculata TaxID=230809 RepID=A0AAD7MPK6_9AGAR|nr:hypothetical protein DFH07DRAFT_852784 [Mycena maculata]